MFFAQGGGKNHPNPANSGTRIKAGEGCYFAIAGGLQGALLLQWYWDASLLMNCLCEITKHTITKSSKETSISNSAHHPVAPGLQLHLQTEKSKKAHEIIFGQFWFPLSAFSTPKLTKPGDYQLA